MQQMKVTILYEFAIIFQILSTDFLHFIFPHHNFVDAFLHLWSDECQRIPLGGESEQKTKGRRKRRALVGLGGVEVIRSAANQEKTTGV